MVSAPLLELTAHPPPVVQVVNSTAAPTLSPVASLLPSLSPASTPTPMPTPTRTPTLARGAGGGDAGLAAAAASALALGPGPDPSAGADEDDNAVFYVVDGVRMDARTYRIAIATTLALMIGLLQVRPRALTSRCRCAHTRACNLNPTERNGTERKGATSQARATHHTADGLQIQEVGLQSSDASCLGIQYKY